MTELKLSVREIAEFCHRQGDIDYRFTPSPSAAEGIAGHQQVQRSRGPDYQAEYPLAATLDTEMGAIRLTGRADGYSAAEPMLEEIKTCRVARDDIPQQVEALHWAQLMLYGGLLCHSESVTDVTLVLTYFHVDSGEQWQRREQHSAPELIGFMTDTLAAMQDWLLLQQEWQQRRDASITALEWPYPEFRDSQRAMAETVYKCVASAGRALLEAPTGTGKTAAALFPALKAIATGKHDRIVFATARTVGRRAAEDGLRQFERRGLALRRLSLTAKEAICFSPGKACHGEDCSFASGYYDRLPAALNAAMAVPDLSRSNIEVLARDHHVCPYQLASDLLPWVDVCIGDLHYVYSFHALVAARYQDVGLSYSVLLDEAHNLPDRARGMYSAGLRKADVLAARKQAGGSVKRALSALNTLFLEFDKAQWQEPHFDSRPEPPAQLSPALSRVTSAVGEALAADARYLQSRPVLLSFFFDCLQFTRVLEAFGCDYRFEMERSEESQSLSICLRCLDPARLLKEKHASAKAVTAFSATVSPASWMLAEMGLEDAVYQSLPSPFAETQLQVELCTHLDTRYKARNRTLQDVATAIADWLDNTPGNCVVYFSAYRYMEEVLAVARPMIQGRAVHVQARNWREDQRNGLLDTLESQRNIAAFCILGGVFGEGVDLPGDALSSVIIVGAGLPAFNRGRDVLKAYYQTVHGSGFEFAYLYPGMQRVSQALGRVVRRESDQGRALLIDPRYAEPAYRSLLPPWWHYRRRDA